MTSEPRTIKPEDIEGYIATETFFTAGEAAQALDLPLGEEARLLTLCVIVLKNGFTVTGESACADPKKFNAEIGRTIARANALNKVWPLMGYVLRSQLAGVSGLLEPEGHKDRVRVEANDLALKLKKLGAFIETDMGGIPSVDQQSLKDQYKAMSEYLDILKARISRFYPLE